MGLRFIKFFETISFKFVILISCVLLSKASLVKILFGTPFEVWTERPIDIKTTQ